MQGLREDAVQQRGGPAVPGKELCEECLKEQKRQANLEILADKVRADEAEDPLEEDISESVDEEE